MESKLNPLPIHKILTTREIDRVMAANHRAQKRALKDGTKTPVIDWMVLNTCLWGLRISESVHLECGQIHREYIELVRTKGNKPRNVLVSSRFSRMLQDHLAWKKSVGESTDDRAPFFYSRRRKGFMTRQGLAKAFKRAIRRAGLEKDLSSHSGRHTLASHTDPLFAQAMLGHARRETTEIYSHLLEAQAKAERYGKKLYGSIT